MNVDEAISGRRAVRDYTTLAVDERTISRLIDAAIHAPSAVNQQPWKFTVVRDKNVLDRISHDAKAHMLATMSAGPHSDHFRSLLGDPAFHIFYHAPALILISASAQGPWIVEDCALAAENLMLAAALGLAPVGSVSRKVFSVRRMEKLRSVFRLPGCRSRRSLLGTRSPHHRPSRAIRRRFVGWDELVSSFSDE